MVATGVLLVGPLSRAQQAGRTYRVAIVHTTTPMATLVGPDPEHTLTRMVLHELRDLGYVEGRNLIFDRRSAEGDPTRYPEILSELVRLNTDVIILPGGPDQIRAALAATRTTPLLLTTYATPVEDGFAASLARPGGSITGLATIPRTVLAPKTLQVFKEAVPALRRVAVLGADYIADWFAEAGAKLGIELLPVVSHPTDPQDSFARVAGMRVDGLYLVLSGTNYAHRKQLGQLAYAGRMPSIDTQGSDGVEAGGLMSYAASPDHWRRLAHFIDRIFKGARPGDLPMELPTRFDLVVNLRTAKAIGIKIPQSILLRATRLIE